MIERSNAKNCKTIGSHESDKCMKVRLIKSQA